MNFEAVSICPICSCEQFRPLLVTRDYSISKTDFEALDIIIPDHISVTNFQTRVKPIDDKVILNCKQIDTLTILRDTLLPKMMSGEVRVN